MKVNFLLVAIVFFSIITTNSCKKADADPSISLRSRKARVVGEWKASSGSVNFRDNGSSYGYSVTGNTANYYISGIPASYNETANVTFTFEKDGTCEGAINLGGYLRSFEGDWDFTSGIGEKKSKTQVVIHITRFTNSNGSYVYSGNFYDITYDLEELRHKLMRITYNQKETYPNGDQYEYSESWELEPR